MIYVEHDEDFLINSFVSVEPENVGFFQVDRVQAINIVDKCNGSRYLTYDENHNVTGLCSAIGILDKRHVRFNKVYAGLILTATEDLPKAHEALERFRMAKRIQKEIEVEYGARTLKKR